MTATWTGYLLGGSSEIAPQLLLAHEHVCLVKLPYSGDWAKVNSNPPAGLSTRGLELNRWQRNRETSATGTESHSVKRGAVAARLVTVARGPRTDGSKSLSGCVNRRSSVHSVVRRHDETWLLQLFSVQFELSL